MRLTAWRITKRKYSKIAFSGEGARLFGGRWNSAGTPIVYTAESQSLAALEMLVHLGSPELLHHYLIFKVEFDESLVNRVELANLPKNWRTNPPPESVRAIGDQWFQDAGSAVLQVPSVLVPLESNFLLNPRHPQFPQLQIGKPSPFDFDVRLAER